MNISSTTPNKRLKEAIDSIPGGLDEVIKTTGISQRTWYNMFKDGSTIKSDYLIEIFNNFGIRPDDILIENFGNNVNEPKPQYDAQEFSAIRFYPNVQASAGTGLIAENEQALPILFRNVFIKRTLSTSAKSLFAMKATGDSMEPEIKDGDLLLIDESRNKVRSERPYVVVIGEQVRVKNLADIGGGKIRLISRNKEYPSEEIYVSDCRILGEVRHIQRTLT